jgi:FkbM family methyltransferase
MSRLLSPNFWKKDLRHLLRQEGFRAAPWLILYRAMLWAAYGVLRISPTFRLTKGGPWLHVESDKQHIGAGSAFIMRDWAEPELHYLHLLVGSGDVFVDIGANIGVYSLIASTLVEPDGSVIAIEPGTDSVRRLRHNVELNNNASIRIVNKALADEDGVTQLYHTGDGPSAFSLVAVDQSSDSEEVEVTTLDHLVRELNLDRLDCLKIDVEGFEPLVLRGAVESIRRFHPKIIFEINSTGAHRSGRPVSEAWELLKDEGYQFYRLDNGKLDSISRFPESGGNVVAMISQT